MLTIAPERFQMRAVFAAVCNAYQPWFNQDSDIKDTLIRRMERNCFEKAIEESTRDGVDRLFTSKQFVERYSAICNRVLANLDPASSVGSTYLIDGVISGSIDPYGIAEMDSSLLCPEASRAEREEMELRQKQQYKEKVSHSHVCRDCGGNETKSREYTGRATDEAGIVSILCVNCGNVWRT